MKPHADAPSTHEDNHAHELGDGSCMDSLFSVAKLSLSWNDYSDLEPSMKSVQAVKWLKMIPVAQSTVLKSFLSVDAYLEDSAQTDLLFEAGKALIDSSLSSGMADDCKKTCVTYAARAFDKAYAFRPESVEIMNAVATLKVYLLEDVMNGVQMFLKVLEKDPQNEAALYNLGMLAIESGQWKKAEERFEKLVFLHPQKEQYSQILEDIRVRGKK